MEEYGYDIWLTQVPNIGPAKVNLILSACGSARECFTLSEKGLRAIFGLEEREIEGILESRKKADPARLYAVVKEAGVEMVRRDSAAFPKSLRTIAQPPHLLFYRGKLPDTDEPSVAIVGARNCSEYGRTIAREIAKRLAELGVTVISGLAMGIDAAGHAGALSGHGTTFAVLGNGPDICYPRCSKNLYEEIVTTGGILSEYAPGIAPCACFFPARNRLISGLSDAVLVIEARRKSGSLITAEYALEQGKEIYALPGRITDPLSEGTNRLLLLGAAPIITIEDFLSDLRISTYKFAKKTEDSKNSLANDENRVYSCLDFVPLGMEELLHRTGLSVPALSETLAALAKKGLVGESFPHYYRKLC